MRNKLFGLFSFLCLTVAAQQQVSLENLNDFKDQAGNWKIVGDVVIDRNIDIHDAPKKEDEKSKKKKKKKKEVVEIPHAVTYSAGTGILLNFDEGDQRDALLTKWEHGDIKLELEVMMPKGSNSGIYFQGRYELQLLDSWGVKNPKFSDIGGIYRNWESKKGKIFRGITPLNNPAKAPGLWQKLAIHFQAPRFNTAGEKIENARFISVDLNGVRIHTNVEVPLYTGGQISKKEAAKGPLMIQGDHGPVAIRNINYILIEESSATLSSLAYKTYGGEYKSLEDINGRPVLKSGEAIEIDVNVTEEEDNYGIVYTGVLNIKEAGEYDVSVGYNGGARLEIDNEIVDENNTGRSRGTIGKTINLSTGSHPFVLTNVKTADWRAPKLGMFIKSINTNEKAFHTMSSHPPVVNSTTPILANVTSEPRMIRGFVDFGGESKNRLSHTMAVGLPSGVNFVYDFSAGNLVGAWRGDFVNATPMWHSRGSGRFDPSGAVQWTYMNQSIAELVDSNSAFPVNGSAPDFSPEGYSIDKSNGLPIFKNTYKGVEIENKITPSANSTHVIREVSFSKQGLQNWYMKIASGEALKMQDGSYAINGQEYYIKMLSGQAPIVRTVDGVTELVVPVDGSNVKYELIW